AVVHGSNGEFRLRRRRRDRGERDCRAGAENRMHDAHGCFPVVFCFRHAFVSKRYPPGQIPTREKTCQPARRDSAVASSVIRPLIRWPARAPAIAATLSGPRAMPITSAVATGGI